VLTPGYQHDRWATATWVSPHVPVCGRVAKNICGKKIQLTILGKLKVRLVTFVAKEINTNEKHILVN
jgi:hypothetical protein